MLEEIQTTNTHTSNQRRDLRETSDEEACEHDKSWPVVRARGVAKETNNRLPRKDEQLLETLRRMSQEAPTETESHQRHLAGETHGEIWFHRGQRRGLVAVANRGRQDPHVQACVIEPEAIAKQ